MFRPDVENTVFAVLDDGINLDWALNLGNENVTYFSLLQIYPYPKISDVYSGYGFREINKVDVGEALKFAETVIFTDIGTGTFADLLRNKGYFVFGADSISEILETDRIFAKKVMKKLGINFPPTKIVKGLSSLKDFVSETEGKVFIKPNLIRGEFETFGCEGLVDLETKLATKAIAILGEDIDFVVEEEMSGVEIGVDTFINKNGFADTVFFTIESKGIGNVTVAMPKDDNPWTNILNKFEPWLVENGYRGMFAMEGFYDPSINDIRVTDITTRCLTPDHEVLTFLHGWKPITDVQVGELVYTLDIETKEVKIEPVIAKGFKEVNKLAYWSRKGKIFAKTSLDHEMLHEEDDKIYKIKAYKIQEIQTPSNEPIEPQFSIESRNLIQDLFIELRNEIVASGNVTRKEGFIKKENLPGRFSYHRYLPGYKIFLALFGDRVHFRGKYAWLHRIKNGTMVFNLKRKTTNLKTPMKVYCIQTPSGTFLTRLSTGEPFWIGNCPYICSYAYPRMIENFSEVVAATAMDQDIEIKLKANFSVQLGMVLDADESGYEKICDEEEWDDWMRYVAVRKAMVARGYVWRMPSDSRPCSLISIGDSLDEAFSTAEKLANKYTVPGTTVSPEIMMKYALKQIERLREYGVEIAK